MLRIELLEVRIVGSGAVRLMLRGWVTCGPAVRRVLDETPEVGLIDMQWDEHWADVVFRDEGFGVEQLRSRLMPAGAWCDLWPGQAGR